MKNKEKDIISLAMGEDLEEVARLEESLAKGMDLLDELNIPKWDSEGNKMLLSQRVSRHREQIEDHLVRLRGLLDK